MELLRDLKKITRNDVSLAGGKGASLGEMMQADISVPFGQLRCANQVLQLILELSHLTFDKVTFIY